MRPVSRAVAARSSAAGRRSIASASRAERPRLPRRSPGLCPGRAGRARADRAEAARGGRVRAARPPVRAAPVASARAAAVCRVLVTHAPPPLAARRRWSATGSAGASSSLRARAAQRWASARSAAGSDRVHGRPDRRLRESEPLAPGEHAYRRQCVGERGHAVAPEAGQARRVAQLRVRAEHRRRLEQRCGGGLDRAGPAHHGRADRLRSGGFDLCPRPPRSGSRPPPRARGRARRSARDCRRWRREARVQKRSSASGKKEARSQPAVPSALSGSTAQRRVAGCASTSSRMSRPWPGTAEPQATSSATGTASRRPTR